VTDSERIDKLRTVTVHGTIHSLIGLEELQQQFDRTAHECDSSAHEVAATALRWASRRIMELEARIAKVRIITEGSELP
jgi:hypothetical protein